MLKKIEFCCEHCFESFQHDYECEDHEANCLPKKAIKDLFNKIVKNADKSHVDSKDRIYYNGFWKGIKESVKILDSSIVLDENNPLK